MAKHCGALVDIESVPLTKAEFAKVQIGYAVFVSAAWSARRMPPYRR
jgi:hypothetical protein